MNNFKINCIVKVGRVATQWSVTTQLVESVRVWPPKLVYQDQFGREELTSSVDSKDCGSSHVIHKGKGRLQLRWTWRQHLLQSIGRPSFNCRISGNGNDTWPSGLPVY